MLFTVIHKEGYSPKKHLGKYSQVTSISNLEAIMCDEPGVSLRTTLRSLEKRVPKILLQRVEE
jgi:hypothetical protein